MTDISSLHYESRGPDSDSAQRRGEREGEGREMRWGPTDARAALSLVLGQLAKIMSHDSCDLMHQSVIKSL